MSSPRVEDISWDEEGAVLVYGETTEAEAEAAARRRLGLSDSDELEVGPLTRFRKVPDQTKEFDMRIIETQSEVRRGSFIGRIVQ